MLAELSRKAKKCHENIDCVIKDSKVSILGVVAIWAIAWLFRKIRGFNAMFKSVQLLHIRKNHVEMARVIQLLI